MNIQPSYRRVLSVRVAAALWLVAAGVGVSSRAAAVVAASESSLFRITAPLVDIRPEQGAAFIASTGEPQLSSHVRPSTARVLENGRPLGPGNALHDTIRSVGRGQFSFWHDYVYLSASDNTDPRTNGRTYAIDYAIVSAAVPILLWRTSLVGFVLAFALTVVLIGSRLGGATIAVGRELPRLLRSAGYLLQSVAALWVMAALLGVAASAAFLARSGTITWVWPEIAIGTMTPEQGVAYVAPLGRNDLSSHTRPSAARVLEDGHPLGPGNSQHIDVRQQGRGRYSFWYDYVLFSASDSSDPRANGRRYTVSYPPVGDGAAKTLYAAAALFFGTALVAAIFTLSARRAEVIGMASGGARRLHEAAAVTLRWAGTRIRRQRQRRPMNWRSPAGIALLASLWIVVGALVVANREVYLARTGQTTALWGSAPLQGFTPELGHAYVSATHRPYLSSHLEPSIARVLEGGKPLGPANSQHVEIRETGQGRFSFWYDYVIFSTSDNTDPRTNGRTYTMAYPEVGATEARLLFLVTLLVGVPVLAGTIVIVRSRTFGELPVRVLKAIWAHRAAVLLAMSAGGLVIIPLLRAAQWPPALVKDAWIVVFGVTLAADWVARRIHGAVPLRYAAVLLIALAAGEMVMTKMAPHKWQGCHTTDAISPWDAFCVAPDSASYYFPYQPDSTRNPLYPWFIDALTMGTGFEPSTYLAHAKAGAVISNPDDPLFRVVRTQIVLLMCASLMMAGAVMLVLRSLFPAAIVLALYDFGFFTAYELNIVLTEPLVQTGLFLIVGAFLVFLWRPRPVWLLSTAVLCGLAYLTRQAATYTTLFLAVMIVRALAEDWRRWWKFSVAAVLLLAALVSIPDVYAFAATGSLTRKQDGIQYQYRIAHALQYATLADLDLMPDEGTKTWLRTAVGLRDNEHRMVDQKYKTEYDRMTFYINQNLYAVAMPAGVPRAQELPLGPGRYAHLSEFYMAVATPILERHWREYVRFAFRFWQLGLTYYPISRIEFGPVGAWTIYAVLWALVLSYRDRYALASATLIAAHWGHVATASLFAVPIPRMVWASEPLVILAATILFYRTAVAFVAHGRHLQQAPAHPLSAAQEAIA